MINFWNIGLKGTNFLIRTINTQYPIEICGIAIGILGLLIMIFFVKKIENAVI